jgi:hypothetical protein
MKFTMALLFSMMSLTAFADCNREVEFFGKARNVVVKDKSVTFQIKFGDFYHVNELCPLYKEEAAQAVVEVAGHAITEGAEISGVLLFDQETQTYRIEL